MKKKPDTYRVWIEQVNQTYVDVTAKDADEAREKGYRKWRKDYAHSSVAHIENQTRLAPPPKRKRYPVEFENAELGDEG